MKKFALILLGIFFIVSCEKQEEPAIKYGGVDGFTSIGSTNEPIQGLRVDLPGYNSKVTDQNGYYKFDHVAAGNYVVSVYQNSTFLDSKSVTVTEGNVAHALFTFEYEEPPEQTKEELPDITVIDISSENLGWDYQVVGKEETFYIEEENSLPKSVFFYSFTKGKGCSIFFNEEGLPKRVLFDHYTILFDNFNQDKVDIGIVSPLGEIQILREIKTDFIWPTSSKSSQSRGDLLRWTGRVVGAIPCALSVAATVVTSGAGVPLIVWSCGNYLLSLTSNMMDDYHVQNGFTEFVDNYSLANTAYSCTTGQVSCLTSITQRLFEDRADQIEEMNANEETISLAEASLYAGHGDVQVTSTWDNESDLDIHVIDPFGEEIYWFHPYSESGGILDYDDIDGYGPENIYWPQGGAPLGTYKLYLHDYVWEGNPESANYSIRVSAFGYTMQFTGKIYLDETIPIAEFDQNGIRTLTETSSKGSPITIGQKKKK